MTDYERIEKVIRYLDTRYLEQPDLKKLAAVAGLSMFHFQRLFSRWAGVSPKGFLKYLTLAHAKELLRGSRSVLESALDSGLSGPGRLHDLSVTVDGVTPGELRTKGSGLEIRYGTHPSPFGPCQIGVTSRGICHMAFGAPSQSMPKGLRKAWPNAEFIQDKKATLKWIARIFKHPGKQGPVRAILEGTAFQIKVWEALIRIPSGGAVSYGDLARMIGKPGSARAVGTAVGSNRIAYLIPCHRVIRETGAFGNYRWAAKERKPC